MRGGEKQACDNDVTEEGHRGSHTDRRPACKMVYWSINGMLLSAMHFEWTWQQLLETVSHIHHVLAM